MPKPLQFKSGSLIYCKGEEAERIYILHSGKVNLVFSDIESGSDMRNQVQPGEFFGVKSALGHFPREENAMVLSDSTVMVFTVPEFEAMAMSNTKIILKMLKVFSNQMRRVHDQVTSLMQNEDIKPEDGLFAIGEKYMKNKRYEYAKYVFGRYLAHYPAGRYMARAENYLTHAEAALANKGKNPAYNDESEEGASPPSDTAASQAYYDAVSLISKKEYEEAMAAFNQIVLANEEPEWVEKSSYESGHCLFLLEKFDDCIKYFKKFLTLYPEYPDLRDVMFYIGQSYEKLENKDQAATWYKKIVDASGDEKDAPRTKALKALHELEKK